VRSANSWTRAVASAALVRMLSRAANGAGQIGYRTAQILAPDVQPEDEAGLRPHLVQDRGRPGAAGPLTRRVHEPGALDTGPAPPTPWASTDRTGWRVRSAKPARIAGCDRAVPAR